MTNLVFSLMTHAQDLISDGHPAKGAQSVTRWRTAEVASVCWFVVEPRPLPNDPPDTFYNSWLAADAEAACDLIKRHGFDRIRLLAACETTNDPDAGRFAFGEVRSLWTGAKPSELIITYADGRTRLVVVGPVDAVISSPMRRLYLADQKESPF